MFNIHFSIERWKWNADFGIYVSNKGRFRTRDKKDLPIKINQKGYCLVRCEGNVNKYRFAHRVVMLTWCPMDDAENLTVDHLDHNKRNNSVENLEWVTQEENWRRAYGDYITVKDDEDVNITPSENSGTAEISDAAKTAYNYYIKFTGGATLSIEQVAAMYFETHRKAFGEGKTIETLNEFTKIIYERSKSGKKILGLKFTRVYK